MERARSQILSAAAELVAESGLRAVTMAALARRARVAKATVYNHFRDRDEILRALLLAQRDALLAHCADYATEQRLAAAASWLAEHPVLAGLRVHDADAVLGLVSAAVGDRRVTEQVAIWAGPTRDPLEATRLLASFAVTGP